MLIDVSMKKHFSEGERKPEAKLN